MKILCRVWHNGHVAHETSTTVPGAGETPEYVLEFVLVERIRRRRAVARAIAALMLIVFGLGVVAGAT